MTKLAEKIMDLRLATRLATMYDSGGEKSTLGLKTKILYLLLRQNMSPSDVTTALGISRPNLTLLAKQMINEGLIEKVYTFGNKWNFLYAITQLGQSHVSNMLEAIEASFCGAFGSEAEYMSAVETLENAASLLSFSINTK